MAAKTGKFAYVNNVPCLASWSANPAVTSQRYAASCTNGGTNVPEGIIDWTGTMAGFGAQPPLFPDGEDFTFQGVIDTTDADNLSLNGTILIESLTININSEDGSAISWEASFGAKGALSEEATSATDATTSAAEVGKDLAIQIGGITGAENIVVAQLVFRRPLSTWVESGSITRDAGPLEADVTLTTRGERSMEGASDFAINAINELDVYVTNSTYWRISLVRWLSKTNFTVERNTPTPFGWQVNGQWNSVDSGTPGFIKGPDDTYHHGEAPA